MVTDPYFSRPEVSHSDLCALEILLYGGYDHDPTEAFAFGSLIDALITEPHKVDHFKRTLNNYTYSKVDFENAKKMQRAFEKDEAGKLIMQHCSFQHIAIKPDFEIDYFGFKFSLPARCKWDYIFPESYKMGGDIKSTTATTQQQFEAACEHFNYYRSRAWYMDITATNKDMLIGISKTNHKIFKITLDRNAAPGSKARDLYEKGKEAYTELAFKYWLLMYDIKTAV